MAQLPQVQPFQVKLSGISSAATPSVGFGQRVDVALPYRAQAAYEKTLSDSIDRMSNIAFGYAEKTAGMAAEQFALDNPLTQEQLKAMSEGNPAELDLGDPLNIYSSVLRKARAIELSGYMEMNARKKLVEIYSKVEKNLITTSQAQDEITAMLNADAQVVGQVSPDAAYKYRASIATFGSATIAKAGELESKRARLDMEQRVADDFEAFKTGAYAYITGSLPIDPQTGVEFDLNNVDKTGILDNLTKALVANVGTQLGSEQAVAYGQKFEAAILQMKQTALQEYFTQERYMENPRLAQQEINAGQAGNLTQLIQEFKRSPDGQKILDGVVDYNIKRVDQRKRGIELALIDDEQKGNQLLREIYTSSNAAEQQAKFNQLSQLAVAPELIKKARDFITSDSATGPQYDDLSVLGSVSTQISLGLATEDDILNANLTRSTKRSLMLQLANPTDPMRYATQQINFAVGIQSADLPPEIDDAAKRSQAVLTRNQLLSELNDFARTPDANGRLPSPPQVSAKGRELAKQANALMSPLYADMAKQQKTSAIMNIPELANVDFNDDAAVQEAITKYQQRKEVSSTTRIQIQSTQTLIEKYRIYMDKANQGGTQ